MRNQFSLAIIFVLSLSSFSCSRFAVYIVESRIVSRADDNFDLDRKQKTWVKERVSFHVKAMRSQFIPVFVQVIDQALLDYQDGLTEDEVFKTVDAVRDAFRPYVKQMMVDFGTFYGTLEARQWERYQLKKQERDAERLKEANSRKAEGEDPLTNIYKRYDELYGPLTQAQKNFLKKLYTDNPQSFTDDERINFNSTLFAQSLSEIIKANLKSEDKIKAMQELFRDPEKVMEAVNYEGVFLRLKENQRKLVVIDAAMTPEQRQHFRDTWQEIRDSLKSFIP